MKKKKKISLPCPTHCVNGRGWVFWEEAKNCATCFLLLKTKVYQSSLQTERLFRFLPPQRYFFRDYFPESAAIIPAPEARWGCRLNPCIAHRTSSASSSHLPAVQALGLAFGPILWSPAPRVQAGMLPHGFPRHQPT